jgi:uptake hydrogenase large subunit
MSPGEVLVAARLDRGRLASVSVQARRPALAPLLLGRTPEAVATLLPLAHAVCARAQAAACKAALAAARGLSVAPTIDTDVAEEALRELLFAVLTGNARRHVPEALRAAADPAALRTLFATTLLGGAAEDWLACSTLAGLERLGGHGTGPLAGEMRLRLDSPEPAACRVTLLPAVDAAGSLRIVERLDAGYVAMPTWHGLAAETGPVARLHAHPLVASLADRPWLQRWLARLLEVLHRACAGQPGTLGQVSAASLGNSTGRSAVVTARGLLLHEVALADGKVVSYAVCAPTEWNFHPAGSLPRWLEGMQAGTPDAARSLVQRAADALDPCVECHVELAASA